MVGTRELVHVAAVCFLLRMAQLERMNTNDIEAMLQVSLKKLVWVGGFDLDLSPWFLQMVKNVKLPLTSKPAIEITEKRQAWDVSVLSTHGSSTLPWTLPACLNLRSRAPEWATLGLLAWRIFDNPPKRNQRTNGGVV